MYKLSTILILLITLLFSQNFKSQSFDETSQWIGNNTKGKCQTYLDSKSKLLVIVKSFAFMSYGRLIQGSDYSAFDPKAVANISQVQNSNGYNLNITFQKYGTTVYSWSDEDKTISKMKRPGMTVEVDASSEMIPKFKKAFLNLFKTLKVNVTDVDIF